MTQRQLAQRREQAGRVVAELARLYPHSTCSLHHRNPLQLLIATILSAQCTDERVNQVTPALFKRYPTAQALAEAKPAELERLIQSTGFYRNKAKSILGCCRAIVERHGGEVPRRLEELVHLPGVGRKTANVVLGTAFGIPGMVVDTHVSRLSQRLGLAKAGTPEKIEQQLMAIVPPEEWVALGHRLIDHGRKVCQARKPRCQECTLEPFCPRLGVKDAPKSAKPRRP